MRRHWMITFLLVMNLVPPLQAQEIASYRIIVNANNPVDNLDRKFLADTYFKKITRWPENGVIQPVDLTPDSPARRKFSEEILNRSVMGIKSYWQQLIFSGRNVPPPELGNEEEVIQYVGRTPGSIGYVSSASIAGTAPAGVKTIGIR